MPLFLAQGRYTGEGFRGLVAKPEHRTEERDKLIAAAGGKLYSFRNALGEYDFLLIADAPRARKTVAALLAAAAIGTVTDLKTTSMLTPADRKQWFANAGSRVGNLRPARKSCGAR